MTSRQPKFGNLIVGLSIALAVGAANRGQSSLVVPAGLLQVADESPEVFAEYLADLSVPAGLELRQSDRPRMKRKIVIDRKSSVPAADVMKAFNDRHTRYTAALANDVFVIRPSTRRVDYLDQPAPVAELQARGIMGAAKKLFSPLDPRIDAFGVTVASGLGGLDVEGEAIEINLSTSGKSVVDVLNEIAKRTPGHAWLILTKGDETIEISQFGFIRRGGSASLTTISRGR